MEKFDLKWNDFSSNVQKSFKNLRKEEDFFDITLVGDDFKHVTAHKLVLASSSEYFKMVFSNNKNYFQSHAMICLEGLNQSDLNNVLDYIYHGEIQIYQHDLDRFLGIAERLKLEGLIGGGDQPEDEDDYYKSKPVVEETVSTPHNNFLVPNAETKMTKNARTKERPVISVTSSNIQSMEDLDQKVKESYSKNSDGSYVCHHCAYTITSSRNMTHMKDHVETHFEGLEFPCTLCETILRSRNSLRHHIKRQHHS